MLNQSLRTSKKHLRKVKLEKPIRKRFNEIKEDDKVIMFTNPKQFSAMKLERINPNHKGLIWGYRKRKYRKIKGKNWIKVAKIHFAELTIFVTNSLTEKIIYYLDYLIYHLYKTNIVTLVLSIYVSLLFYALCFKVGSLK